MLTREADDEFVRRAAARFAQRLATAVGRYRADGRDPRDLLGSPEELAERALAAQAPELSPWDELVGPFLRSGGVQARLGITRQAVAAKAARRRLLRLVTADGVVLFPAWQFDGAGVVAGLPEVMALFPEDALDGWTLAGWLRTEDAEFGTSPMELLGAGRGDLVRVVARRAAAALAA